MGGTRRQPRGANDCGPGGAGRTEGCGRVERRERGARGLLGAGERGSAGNGGSVSVSRPLLSLSHFSVC